MVAPHELTGVRARYMDPVTGRFVTEDHERRDADWYGYARSSPTGYADRSGSGDRDVRVDLTEGAGRGLPPAAELAPGDGGLCS